MDFSEGSNWLIPIFLLGGARRDPQLFCTTLQFRGISLGCFLPMRETTHECGGVDQTLLGSRALLCALMTTLLYSEAARASAGRFVVCVSCEARWSRGASLFFFFLF